jgi:hypothetical protein
VVAVYAVDLGLTVSALLLGASFFVVLFASWMAGVVIRAWAQQQPPTAGYPVPRLPWLPEPPRWYLPVLAAVGVALTGLVALMVVLHTSPLIVLWVEIVVLFVVERWVARRPWSDDD